MKNTNDNKVSMQELTWQDVRSEVSALNPELAKVIDGVDPGPEYTIFKLRYPFGSEILKNGPLQLPDKNGNLIFIDDKDMDPGIRAKLGYNLDSNPVGFILKNSVELFIFLDASTVPLYGLIHPGRIFGTWQILNPQGFHNPVCFWSMTAGARSLFLLPKISDNLCYTRLKKAFNLDVDKPKKLRDHWNIFREIANHPDFGESWETEILFFSKVWFERLDDPAWQSFKLYLLDQAWKGSEFFRNQFMWDLIFSNIQNDREIKPDPYIADTVRHILGMSAGALPGFAPALNDEAGPVKKLQKVFREIYRTEYEPVMMQPYFLNKKDNRPVYYSLEQPTTIKFSPKSRSNISKIDELFAVQSLLNKYLLDIRQNKYNVANTPIFEASKIVEYTFFHPDNATLSGIQSHKDIQEGDPAFKGIKNFPYTSTFIAGCIRLKIKDKPDL